MRSMFYLVAVLAMLVGVSCSKQEQETSGSAERQGAAGASGEPIRIGAIFAVTGPAGFLGGPEKQTAEMLVEQINREGGLHGRPIELIVKDSVGSPEKTLSFARQLIEEEQVLAIIGPTRSGSTMKIKDVCEQNKTILISCAAAEAIVEPVARYVFKVPQKDSFAAQKIFLTMKEMGITKAAAICGNTGFGKGGKDQLAAYAPDYGVELVLVESYDAQAADLSDLMTKVKATDAEAVINWSITPAQGIVAKNMRQKGLTIPLFQSHGFGNIKYVEMGGDASEGILFPCGRLLIAEQLPDDHPQKEVLMAYKQDYEARFDEPVSTFGGHAYDALMLLVQAIETVGADDPEKVRDAIEHTKGFVGTGGVFNFSPTEHNGLDLDSFDMLIVKDGQFALLE